MSVVKFLILQAILAPVVYLFVRDSSKMASEISSRTSVESSLSDLEDQVKSRPGSEKKFRKIKAGLLTIGLLFLMILVVGLALGHSGSR